MAQLGRSGLIGESNGKFPTNNAKIIKAIDHRSYNSDMIDSKFNLIDDVLNDVNYFDGATTVTLENYLDALIAINIVRGSVYVGDVGNLTIGSFPTTTGELLQAEVINNSNFGGVDISEIKINITSDTSNYMVITSVVRASGGLNTNDIQVAIQSKTTTDFVMSLVNRNPANENLILDISVLRLP